MNDEDSYWGLLLPEFWKQFTSFFRARSVFILFASLVLAVIQHSLVAYVVERRWLVFVVAVLIVAFVFHTFGAAVEAAAITGRIFFKKSIDTFNLETASNRSGVIFYFSNIPAFSDWFRPELVNYLLITSPHLRDYHQQKTKGEDPVALKCIQHAARIFVLDAKLYHYLHGNCNHRETKCAAELDAIHNRLGISPVLLTTDDIVQIRGNCATLDFCLAFRNVNNLNEIIENKSRYYGGQDVDVLEPDSPEVKKVHEFHFVGGEKKAPFVHFGFRVLEKIWDQQRNEYRPEYCFSRIASCHAED